jgi:hypothetical protein
MALSDLAVFSEYAYSSMTEVLDQQVEKFNGASQGTIVLQPSAYQGDYSETAFFKKISGLVRRRNAYGSGAQTPVDIEHLVDTMVKVAGGTPPVNIPPSQFRWIQRNPEEAAAAMGQQLAVDMLADMLNTAIGCGDAALGQVAAVNHDGSAGTLDPSVLNIAASKFGDRSGDIVAWIAHSKCLHDYYGNNLANAERLFTYGTVNVMADAFGRVFIITDSPSLINTTPSPDQYTTLGLVSNAIMVGQNNDFEDNFETTNGDENIQRTYQAEWSYQLGIKGFSWDKSNGGASPNDAALLTATNWDKVASFDKDLAGVRLVTQ